MDYKKIKIPMFIEVDTIDEFESWARGEEELDSKLEISKTIVHSILDNLDLELIHIFEVFVKEQNTIYDISVTKEDFIFTLEKNLKIMEKYEEFELCDKILKTIYNLKND